MVDNIHPLRAALDAAVEKMEAVRACGLRSGEPEFEEAYHALLAASRAHHSYVYGPMLRDYYSRDTVRRIHDETP